MFGSRPKAWRGPQGQQTLFCRSDMGGVLRTREDELLKRTRNAEIKSWERDDLAVMAKQLVAEAMIPIPVFDWEKVKWTEGEMRIDVRHRPEFFGGFGDGHTDGEWMKATVPLEGQSEILEWHGSSFTTNPPIAILSSRTITMAIEDTRSKLTVAKAQEEYEKWKQQVARGTEVLRSDQEGWRSATEERVLEMLIQRAHAQAERIARASELNRLNTGRHTREGGDTNNSQGRNSVGNAEVETPRTESEGENRGGNPMTTSASEIPRHDVFLSFAGEQREDVVKPLRKALENEEVTVWMDHFNIAPGQNWQRKIQEAMEKARYIVIVVSRESLQKEWPRRELDKAVRLGLVEQERVIPVLVGLQPDDTRVQSEWIGSIQGIQWRGEPKETARQIARVVNG